MAKRKTHSAAFKAQVALAAIRGDRTMNQVAAQFGVHPTLIHGWRKKLLAGAAGIFEAGGGPAPAGVDPAELFEQIGRLKMELEWLKKKAAAVV
jgi:putative transposase